MESILKFLFSPQTLFIYGPLSAFCITEAVALWYIWNRHEKLHEDRIQDVTKMKDEYIKVVDSVEKTLNILIQVLSKRGDK